MLSGTVCELCGMFFVHAKPEPGAKEAGLYEHGYPVVCWECWNELSKKQRKNHKRALVPTL